MPLDGLAYLRRPVTPSHSAPAGTGRFAPLVCLDFIDDLPYARAHIRAILKACFPQDILSPSVRRHVELRLTHRISKLGVLHGEDFYEVATRARCDFPIAGRPTPAPHHPDYLDEDRQQADLDGHARSVASRNDVCSNSDLRS